MHRKTFSKVTNQSRPSFSRTYCKESIDTNMTRTLKDQLSVINSERKSLTRLSLNSFTRELDTLHSKRPSARQKDSRDSLQPLCIKRQSIVKNLVDKLQHQQQLKSIIENKYKPRHKNKQNIPFRSQSNEYLMKKLKQSQKQIQKLKYLLIESQSKIKKVQEDGSRQSKCRTSQKSTQTFDQFQQRLFKNIDSVLQQLDNKYRLY